MREPCVTGAFQDTWRLPTRSGLRAIARLRSRSFSKSLTFSEKESARSRWRVARLLSRTLRIQSLMDYLNPMDRGFQGILRQTAPTFPSVHAARGWDRACSSPELRLQ